MIPALLLASLASNDAHALDLWGTGPLSSSTLLVNSETYIRYRHIDDTLPGFEDREFLLDFGEQVERLNLSLTKNRFTMGTQIDQVALFFNKYILDGELVRNPQLYTDPQIISPFEDILVVMEKIYLQQRWNALEVTVGDTYATFGRGIALNVVRNAAIDIDSSIRGGKAIVHAGDMDFTVVSGLTNRQQVNRLNFNIGLDQDPPHMISGGRIEHYALGPVQAGVHGTIARFARAQDFDKPGITRYEEDLDVSVTGATVEALGVLGADWYIEGDLFNYRTPEIAGQEDPLNGWIVYGSSSFYPGPFVILLDGKVSKNTERINSFIALVPNNPWEMSTPPTLEYERVITEDSAATVNSNDVFGARARVDWAIKPGEIIPYASMVVLRDNDLVGHFNRSPETIVHPLVGGQFFPDDKIIIVNGGFRRDIRDDPEEGFDQLVHVDGEVTFPLFGEEALEVAVSVRRFRFGENIQGQEPFISMENALVWKRGEKLDLILYQDWTDNPLFLADGVGNMDRVVTALFDQDWGENLFLALEAQYKPNPGSELSVFLGAYKAGIRCSGGQCRQLPGLNGGQLTYTTQF
ncbi:MAG: DUF6029 family protein [Myxococcota bacterium]